MKVLIRYYRKIRSHSFSQNPEYIEAQDGMMLDVAHPNDIHQDFEKELSKRGHSGARMAMWLPEDFAWGRKR